MRGLCTALVAALAAPAAAPRDYPRERTAARNAILTILHSSPEVRSVTARLSKMVSLKGLQRPVTSMPGMLRAKWPGIDRAAALVPATCEDIWEHLSLAMKTVHPIDADGSREATDLRNAVSWSQARGTNAPDARDAIWARCDEMQASLLGVTRRCMAQAPQHIREMPAPGPHVAWIFCCAEAMGWPDPYLVEDMCCGAPTSGVIPDSGVLRAKHRPATKPMARCGHDGRTTELMGSVEPRSPEAAEGAIPLWERTMAEVLPGDIPGVPHNHQGKALLPWTTGPFTKAALDVRFGMGCYVPLRRFAVVQNGEIRPCDNGAASGHNDASGFEETITCESADFPARAARLFADAADGSHSHSLHGGTDDMEKAYRRVAVDVPQVVCMWDPFNKSPTFFVVSGFPFGLASAVNAFNRLTSFLTAFNRRVLHLPSGNFYDDFVIVERAFAAYKAQKNMASAVAAFGYPFSAKKHKPAALTLVFLGVTSCFTAYQPAGVVSMFVAAARIADLRAEITRTVHSAEIRGMGAAKLVGRLMFTLSWAAGSFGKAVLQPLFAVSQRTDTLRLGGAVLLALLFFVQAFEPGRLQPRVYHASRRATRRPVLIWTDAMYAEDASNGGSQAGFMAFLPDESGEEGRGRWIHGSAVISQEFISRFLIPAKTYIGQLELLAAVAVYYSIDPSDLRDRKVIHWIDNTGALAAMVKGYARQIDSARIVHAFAALAITLNISPWFEYVRTKANIADLPSREGLQGYCLFEDTEFVPKLGSTRVVMRMPPMDAWGSPFGDWIRSARANEAKHRGRNRGSRDRKRKDRGS